MGKNYSYLNSMPIVLQSNRVWRTYQGGMKIEQWQGKSDPRDNSFPEEWVASTVKSSNPGRENYTDEGLSTIEIDGETITLKQLIDSDPRGFLGEKHVRKYGNNMAVLFKVLDSKWRLSIQVHPDREFAAKVFNSSFGKTEAWLVLGSREIDETEPYLLFGFKPGITKEKWRELFEQQDIEGMIDSLHRIPVIPGEVWLIKGGLPHAIGPGCFLIEVQEPTDYTIRDERTTIDGHQLPDALCHQGAGFDKIFDCFHYEPDPYEETLKKWRIKPRLIQSLPGAKVTELVGERNTDKFRLLKYEIGDKVDCHDERIFSVVVVISGSGAISYQKGKTLIQQGDQLFLPANLGDFEWQADPGKELILVRAYPPR